MREWLFGWASRKSAPRLIAPAQRGILSSPFATPNRRRSLLYHIQRIAQPLLVLLFALALYIRTGAPSLLTGDQAEHQMVAAVLGVPHATGYPLFTLLNALAVRVPLAADLARRVTLMTALWSALAVMLVYLIAYRLTGRSLAALLAAASLAVSSEFWSLSVITEVYTFQAVLILMVWLCLLNWWAVPNDARRLSIATFCSGLAVSHHGSFVPIVGPALLLVVALPLLRVAIGNGKAKDAPSIHHRPTIIWRSMAWGVLGFVPWLYLAAQFSLFHPFDYYRGLGLPYHYYWGNPASWGDVLNLAFGAGFRGKVFTHGWSHLATLTEQFVTTLRQEFWWHGFLLGALGGVALIRRSSRAGVFSALIFLCAALFGINVAGDIPKAHVYYLPAYVIWSVWIGIGAGLLADVLCHLCTGRLWTNQTTHERPIRTHSGAYRILLARHASVMFPFLLLMSMGMLPLLLGWRRFDRIDRSADTMPRRLAAGILAEVAPNAVILCRWELCQPIQYLQLVEQQRLDVQLDQTEPEAGSDWAERASLYLAQHPVYALQLNEQLAARYQIYPVSETYDLWQVVAQQTSTP